MSFTELLAAAKALPREEQFQLIEGLQDPTAAQPATDVYRKSLIPSGARIEFWSPIFAPETAAAMMRALDEEKKRRSENASA